MVRHIASSRACAPSSATTWAGSIGSGAVARDRAHPGRAIGARKQLGSQDLAARLLVLEEQRLRGNGLAGLEHEAVALVAEHRGQGQPARRQDRPRSHGDDHGVALDDLAAVERDAAYRSGRPSHQLDDRAVPQLGALCLGGAHQARGEGARLDQRRRLRRAELTRERHSCGQPRSPASAACRVVLDGITAIRREAPIAPGIAELVGELGVEREAAPCQSVERRAAAPVERQKAARLARRRTGHGVALDHDGLCPAPAEEVGDGDTDRAAAADDDAFGAAHACPAICPSGRDAPRSGAPPPW